MSRLSRQAFLEAPGAITTSAFAIPTIAARGLVSDQPQPKRLGWLYDDRPGERVCLLTAFRAELPEVQNLRIDARWSNQQIDHLPALAAEVVALRPDVVVGVSIFTVRALAASFRDTPNRYCRRARPCWEWARGKPGSPRRKCHRDNRPGGLFGYGPNMAQLYRGGSYFVDRIRRGARLADLPIEQPTSFEFVVSQATAQAPGMSIFPDVVRKVTEWVE